MKNACWQSSKGMLLLLLLAGACASQERDDPRSARKLSGIEAIYANGQVIVDGWLDEMTWRDAPTYPLHLAKNQSRLGAESIEAGSVRLVWGRSISLCGGRTRRFGYCRRGRERSITARSTW